MMDSFMDTRKLASCLQLVYLDGVRPDVSCVERNCYHSQQMGDWINDRPGSESRDTT
jgi:hypothetical protein